MNITRKLLAWASLVALGYITPAPLVAQAQVSLSHWIVQPAEVKDIDSLEVVIKNIGGTLEKPDIKMYLIHAPWLAARDSLFLRTDASRYGVVGKHVAVTGPWKRFISFIELDGLVEIAPDSLIDNEAASPQSFAVWSIPFHGADLAWQMGARGQGTVGAGADTGIDQFHREFSGRFLRGLNVGTNGTNPVDSTNFTDTIGGCNGHGTHTTSSIVGATVGMAPDASAVHYRVFDSGGGGCLAYASSTTRAILDATRVGYDAVNVSIGHGGLPYSLGVAVTGFRNAGGIVCGSNGNSGTSGLFAPAGFADAVASAAVDGSGNRAGFSQYGAETDFGSAGVGVNGAMPGGGYAAKSGTSMASPTTCGLFLQLFSTPEFKAMARNRAKVDSAQALLCASAERKPAGGRDVYTGCGTPNIARAIAMMRGGVEIAGVKTDTIPPAAQIPPSTCKTVVSTKPWSATTDSPWITLSSTPTQLCYSVNPSLIPAGVSSTTAIINYRSN